MERHRRVPNESVVIGISHKDKLQGDLHFILFILLQSPAAPSAHPNLEYFGGFAAFFSN